MQLQFDISFDLELESIIALATMTYVVEYNLYGSHPMYEGVLNDFIIEE